MRERERERERERQQKARRSERTRRRQKTHELSLFTSHPTVKETMKKKKKIK